MIEAKYVGSENGLFTKKIGKHLIKNEWVKILAHEYKILMEHYTHEFEYKGDTPVYEPEEEEEVEDCSEYIKEQEKAEKLVK